ncbi:MAG: 50S ribosomal protein L5 [Candidatus Aenigmarchaeota archaeon]|nr:50S ribosomal protein L5 [Candidatus Aenigmarchaeota archaeon]
MNSMREIKLEKVTLNIGCGEPGEKLEKAKKLLASLTGKKIVETHTTKRSTFGTPKGRAIGCKITLRGNVATDMLKRVLESIDLKVKRQSFDAQGNVSFGVKEHIQIPGVKYDPDIGIYGMDICVTLKRKGFRIMRKRNPTKISESHKITPEDSEKWFIENFDVKVE